MPALASAACPLLQLADGVAEDEEAQQWPVRIVGALPMLALLAGSGCADMAPVAWRVRRSSSTAPRWSFPVERLAPATTGRGGDMAGRCRSIRAIIGGLVAGAVAGIVIRGLSDDRKEAEKP